LPYQEEFNWWANLVPWKDRHFGDHRLHRWLSPRQSHDDK